MPRDGGRSSSAACVRGLVLIAIADARRRGTPLWQHVLCATGCSKPIAAALLAPAVFAVVQWEKRALGLT